MPGAGSARPGESRPNFKPGEGPGAGNRGRGDKEGGKGHDEGAHGASGEGANEHARGRQRNEFRALREELKSGNLKKADLEARLAKLRDSNKERQQMHRAALKARWGEALGKAEVKQELELHERRMARLNRMLLLVQTERAGKDAEKLAERVEKLIELETARHERKMGQIGGRGAGAMPAASGGVPAASGVVPAASGATLGKEGAK